MFTNRHEIRRIDLLKSEYTQVVPTLKNAVALDVDVSTNKMFWCDLYHRKIYRYTHAHTMYRTWTRRNIGLGMKSTVYIKPWMTLDNVLSLCFSSIHPSCLFQPVTPSGYGTGTPGGCVCVNVCVCQSHLEGCVICLTVKGGAVCPSHTYSMYTHTTTHTVDMSLHCAYMYVCVGV